MADTSRSKQFRRTKNKKSLTIKLFHNYKYKARIRDIQFTLEFEEFAYLIHQKCYLCGLPPSNIMKRKDSQGSLIYSGVDRVDNSLGYIKENCRPACHKCNAIKSNRTLKETIKHVKKIISFYRPIKFGAKK